MSVPFHLFHLALESVCGCFSLGIKALPAFPSLLSLECGLWFVAFKASVSSLIESAGLLATPFPLLLETPPVGSQPLCVPFYLFHLALGRVRGLFSPGFEALPEFHNCRLLGVVFGSLRFTRPTSSLRECGGLLATAIHLRFETRPV